MSTGEGQGKPTIPEVIDRFTAYQDTHPGWGSLHIVLEDGNVGDDMVAFCAERAESKGDGEGRELALLLMRMSRTQRRKLGRML